MSLDCFCYGEEASQSQSKLFIVEFVTKTQRHSYRIYPKLTLNWKVNWFKLQVSVLLNLRLLKTFCKLHLRLFNTSFFWEESKFSAFKDFSRPTRPQKYESLQKVCLKNWEVFWTFIYPGRVMGVSVSVHVLYICSFTSWILQSESSVPLVTQTPQLSAQSHRWRRLLPYWPAGWGHRSAPDLKHETNSIREKRDQITCERRNERRTCLLGSIECLSWVL